MREVCELCRRDAFRAIYAPERSTRGITIHICDHCGLLQSLPRADRAERQAAAVSSGADWGNVRYGKGFRTAVALDALARHADLSADITLLDVGSNRASFARKFLEAAPKANVVAVEPDERVAQSTQGLARAELIHARIEDVPLETGRFDVVHSCHTIEHLAHPARVLADHWRVLKDEGLLILDAPNTAILGASDVVEEWFIDKHLYHFSARTLERLIEEAGFEVVEGPRPDDRSNLLFVARKTNYALHRLAADGDEVMQSEGLVRKYVSTRARNLAALTTVAAEITELAPRGVVVWGAGRLFDSLVVHGRLDARDLTLLIDTYLKSLVGECHGRALADPEALRESDASVVVVMSRDFAGEIAAQARALAPHAEILLYSDLLSRARARVAA
jgi:SAM-dependent methyltransferase